MSTTYENNNIDERNEEMEQYLLQTLCVIKEKYASYMAQVDEIDKKMEDAMGSYVDNLVADNRVLPALNLFRAYRLASKCERKEMRLFRAIKEELVQTGLYREDEIALDINEVLDGTGKARVLIGPIDYRAYYKAEMLANLEVVFSDASLTSLLHPSALKRLRYVMGNLRVGYLTSPLHLRATGGDVDLKKLNDPKMLPDYKITLGDVYVSHYSPDLALEEIGGDLHIMDDDSFDASSASKITSLGGSIYLPKVSDEKIKLASFQKTYKIDNR